MNGIAFDISVPADDRTRESRQAREWKTVSITWEALADRCSQTIRTSETFAEYALWQREDKARATKAKDVGGFIGGALTGSLRRKDQVASRSMLTLDIDKTEGLGMSADLLWQSVVERLDVTALCYTTHTHSPSVPRMRVIVPTNRPMSVIEHEAVARHVAVLIGMEMMDTTAFSAEHMMFWPSTASDGEFYFNRHDSALLDVDSILAECSKQKPEPCTPNANRELPTADPRLRNDVIGAFCRAYTIEDIIDSFLSDAYGDKTVGQGVGETARYTCKGGSTAHGLVCYDHLWAYSNHSTDPARGKRYNAFDLVRIHRFGPPDGNNDKLSFKKMCEWAMTQPKVRAEHLHLSDCDRWKSGILFNNKEKPEPSATNILYILANDPALRGRLWHDDFDEAIHCKGLPWSDNSDKVKDWTDSDDVEMRLYFDLQYGIRNSKTIDDCVVKTANNNRRHSVRDYFASLPPWDGTERLDMLIVKFYGADDTLLNRAMTRKWVVGAVRRVMEPGCKFDYCLTLTGKQGIGKSSFFSILGGEWYNGSLASIEGKDAREALRGSLIIELGELSSLKRSDVEYTKAFISECNDKYRAPYGRRVTSHPRQCVFGATTNEQYFLKDQTGNRRFWIIAVSDDSREGSVSDIRSELKKLRDQIWAEALFRYEQGEPTYLTRDLEAQQETVNASYMDDDYDDLPERIDCYLSRNIPVCWNQMSLYERRQFYGDPLSKSDVRMQVRTTFTAREFLVEYLGQATDKHNRHLSRRINAIMKTKPDWKATESACIYTAIAGQQRGFRREIIDDGDMFYDSS